jgi:DNA-directed RNA polymerase specialized sigma24 family protein
MNVDKDDGELAARALTGEHAAFGRLTRRHKEPLYRLLRRLTGDPDEAYGLLQETFLALWSALSRHDPARSFEGWARRLGIAIAALPPAMKEPLILAAIEGLSQREVADALGIIEKAVETRIRRTRARLTTTLALPTD